MPLRQQYAKDDFESEYRSDPKAGHLVDALTADIHEILHEVVSNVVNEIVAQLNARGHNLRYYEDPAPGTIVLRDDSGEGVSYRCDLRLAVDTVVSIGFRDTTDQPDTLERGQPDPSHP